MATRKGAYSPDAEDDVACGETLVLANEIAAHEVSILMEVRVGQVFGAAPRAKVSMMVMMPAQHGQRSVASGRIVSAGGAFSGEARSCWSTRSARILSMLAARTALANRP